MKKIIIPALLVLTGCQTKQIPEMDYSERKALAQEIVQRCNDQGVKPGTQQMEICIAAEVQSEHARRQGNLAQAQRSQSALAAGLQSVSQSYNQAAARTSMMNRSVTCRTVPAPAGMSKMRCY